MHIVILGEMFFYNQTIIFLKKLSMRALPLIIYGCLYIDKTPFNSLQQKWGDESGQLVDLNEQFHMQFF